MDGARGELFCQRKYRQKFWKVKLPSAHCSWLQPYIAADCNLILNNLKGSSDPSHFIFEIGRSRIRFFPTLISKIKWLRSELSLVQNFRQNSTQIGSKRPLVPKSPIFGPCYLVQIMVRTHIFLKTRPNGPSETLSSMQLQVMLLRLVVQAQLFFETWKLFCRSFFENIFEEFLK